MNRRIPQLPISVEEARRKKRPRPNVVFVEEEDIINPGEEGAFMVNTKCRIEELLTSRELAKPCLGSETRDELV